MAFQASSHGCSNPACRAFASPTPLIQLPPTSTTKPKTKTALTRVHAKDPSKYFTYASHPPNLLNPHRAPKPLNLVPVALAQVLGMNPDHEILLNMHSQRRKDPIACGTAAMKRRERAWKAPGESGLRWEVGFEGDEAQWTTVPTARAAASGRRTPTTPRRHAQPAFDAGADEFDAEDDAAFARQLSRRGGLGPV